METRGLRSTEKKRVSPAPCFIPHFQWHGCCRVVSHMFGTQTITWISWLLEDDGFKFYKLIFMPAIAGISILPVFYSMSCSNLWKLTIFDMKAMYTFYVRFELHTYTSIYISAGKYKIWQDPTLLSGNISTTCIQADLWSSKFNPDF